MLDQKLPCKAALHLKQGSPEWLSFRKTKIGASDAAPIMGVSRWKTPERLFQEKMSDNNENKVNAAMQRGIDLEPLAREFFTYKTGIKLIDKNDPRNVLIHPNYDWMMASFDGISECGEISVEIKCPGDSSPDFEWGKRNEVSKIYYPQVQHQIEVKNPKIHYYLVFNGFDGYIFEVKRDSGFINEMMHYENHFYQCMLNKKFEELHI